MADLTFDDDLLQRFVWMLQGQNRSQHTIKAYANDVRQFAGWLSAQQPPITSPLQVSRSHIDAYLGHLAKAQLTGVTRARKLVALRTFFRHLEASGDLTTSPINGVQSPRKERKVPVYLTKDEYSKLLALAGANRRDFAILTLLLQTGIRVSELAGLRLGDIDLKEQLIKVRGKGQAERMIELEPKGIKALKEWLKERPAKESPEVPTDRLFLNRFGQPLGTRGLHKLLVKYALGAGIAKQASPHTLRHTFATAKAEQGVDAFLLREWLGHRSLTTTQRYVSLSRKNGKKVMADTSL